VAEVEVVVCGLSSRDLYEAPEEAVLLKPLVECSKPLRRFGVIQRRGVLEAGGGEDQTRAASRSARRFMP